MMDMLCSGTSILHDLASTWIVLRIWRAIAILPCPPGLALTRILLGMDRLPMPGDGQACGAEPAGYIPPFLP
eukprot:3443046-Prymnesium_polylepis.1